MDKKRYEETLEELTLMLMYLTRFQDDDSKFQEISWKGYPFATMNQLEEADQIIQFRKYVQLTEEGRNRARALLAKYQLADFDLYEKFEFRNIHPDEAEQASEIEQICFPPEQACSKEMMRMRVEKASELFLVAVDKKTGQLAGFLNGLSTDECSFRDEFFTDVSLHDPNGKNIMLLGLDVLPEYRRQGLARELMSVYLRREQNKGRQVVLLTCLAPKVKMYKKMGFCDMGIANSSWGQTQWHEMHCFL